MTARRTSVIRFHPLPEEPQRAVVGFKEVRGVERRRLFLSRGTVGLSSAIPGEDHRLGLRRIDVRLSSVVVGERSRWPVGQCA